MTRRFRVSLTARAEEDLIGIWLGIAEDSPRDADQLLDAFDDRIDSLIENPERGAPRPALGRDIRILVESNFLIIYRVRKSGVAIIRIVHGARDLRRLILEE